MTTAKSYPKGSKEKLSGNFSVYEFDCPCDSCTVTLLEPALVSRLQDLRTALGKAIKITSGYRCVDYQLALRLRGYETAVGISTHERGAAADLMCEGYTGESLEHFARKAGFTSVGVGHSFIHVDTRPGDRRWLYTKR